MTGAPNEIGAKVGIKEEVEGAAVEAIAGAILGLVHFAGRNKNNSSTRTRRTPGQVALMQPTNSSDLIQNNEGDDVLLNKDSL